MDLGASYDPQEPAAGTSPRLPARSLRCGLRQPRHPRKFRGDSRSRDSTAHPVRDALPAAPGRPGSPGAPANLTPRRHSSGRCAPLAMARLRAACSPRSAPDTRHCLQRASSLRRRLAAMRAAPRTAGSAALPPTGARAGRCGACPVRLAGRRRGAELGGLSPPGFCGSHGRGLVQSELVGAADAPA